MDPTILFTHLKIILLQCFHFSVFSNNEFNSNTPIGSVWIELIFAETENTVAKSFLNVRIVLWDLFLMKKLLKSEICGSVNSARMYCSQQNSQLLRAKKKKRKTQRVKRRIQTASQYRHSQQNECPSNKLVLLLSQARLLYIMTHEIQPILISI